MSEPHVIPKEKAVFWLDKNGRWCNEHGPFEHKKIIDHFHASIKKDGDGYYLYQSNGESAEKVYFFHEDAALFAFKIEEKNGDVFLILNTGKKIILKAENLFIKGDNLYMRSAGDIVKFSEHALFQISRRIDFTEDQYRIQIRGKLTIIPQNPS